MDSPNGVGIVEFNNHNLKTDPVVNVDQLKQKTRSIWSSQAKKTNSCVQISRLTLLHRLLAISSSKMTFWGA